jgi:hypothetical protein
MITRTLVLLIVFLTASSNYASASSRGERGGNGGDICLRRFEIVRNDVESWILRGGADGLQLPRDLSVKRYKSLMLDRISGAGAARISCVGPGEEGFPVKVLGRSRTCKNFFDRSGAAQIVCDANKFNGTPESDQYILVHHEFAGLSGIEFNRGEDSDFETVSDQITGFLENQVVKKLAIKPRSTQSSVNYGPYPRPCEKFSGVFGVDHKQHAWLKTDDGIEHMLVYGPTRDGGQYLGQVYWSWKEHQNYQLGERVVLDGELGGSIGNIASSSIILYSCKP